MDAILIDRLHCVNRVTLLCLILPDYMQQV